MLLEKENKCCETMNELMKGEHNCNDWQNYSMIIMLKFQTTLLFSAAILTS